MSNRSGTTIKNWGRAGLALLFLTFLCTCGRAQEMPLQAAVYEVPHRKYTVREGLTRNQLMHVWEDQDGLVWLVGKRGVDRFDGLEFLSYQNDTNAIREYILDIDEDEDGALWFFGEGADYRYAGGAFERQERETCGSSSGLARANGRSYRFRHEQRYTGELTPFIQEGWNDSVQRPPFMPRFTDEGAAYITQYSKLPDTLFYQRSFPNGTVKVLATAEDIMPVRASSCCNYTHFSWADSLFQISNGQLHYLAVVPGFQSHLAYYSHKGSYLSRHFSTVTALGEDRSLLYAGKHLVGDLFQRKDRLWLASEQGLVSLRPKDALTVYPTTKGMVENVWSMVGAAAGAGEGTEGAVFFFPYTESSILMLKDGQYERLPGLSSAERRGLEDTHFYPGAIRRKSGHFLLPTNKQVLDFDPVSKQLRRLDGYLGRPVNDILEVGNTIYAATHGLAVYENDRLQKTYGTEDGLDVDELGYLETVAQGKDERVWLGSHRGLAVREPDGTFRNYYQDSTITAGVVDIKSDYQGNLWFATHAGVAFYDYTDSLPRWIAPSFTEDVKFVQPIGEDYVLLGGTNKLFFLDLKAFYAGKLSIYPYDEDDGFPVAECLQSAVYQDGAGDVWVGTTESVIKIEPDRLVFHHQPTDPEFLSFSYLNPLTQKEVQQNIPFNENGCQHFTVSSTDQQVSIRFFTVNHDKPHSITYQYRLLGYRDDWSRPAATRYAEFGELPPGNYSFELRACLLGKCTEAKALKITVTAGRWYEYAVVPWLAGLLALLPFCVIAYQWWKRRKAEMASQRLEVERLQLYRRLTQHKIGPHFANNALTAISSLIIRKENDRALRYTGRFARLFRPVLEDGLPLLRPLSEELDFIDDYLKLETLRFSEKLAYHTEISEEVRGLADETLVPTLLIQSFVNNAVKHGIEPLKQGGELKLKLTLANQDYLLVEITDNGPGYFVDGEATGTGIRAAEEILGYLDEHHRSASSIDISLKDPMIVNAGTVIRLHLYLHYQTLD